MVKSVTGSPRPRPGPTIRSFSTDSYNGSKNRVNLIHKRQTVHAAGVEGYYSLITNEAYSQLCNYCK